MEGTAEDDLIPTAKLAQNIAKLRPEEAKKRFLLLVATGAICPVHRGHVQILEHAKEFLESSGNTRVLAGYISPSHPFYVDHKMQSAGATSISGPERVALTRVATAESDWICETGWEAAQRNFMDYPLVASRILSYCRQRTFSLPADCKFSLHLDLVFVCGSDLALRHRLFLGADAYFPFDVVSVARQGGDGEADSLKQLMTEGRAGKGFFFCEKEVADISSTALRNKLIKGEDIADLTFPSVVEYMKANKIVVRAFIPGYMDDDEEDEDESFDGQDDLSDDDDDDDEDDEYMDLVKNL